MILYVTQIKSKYYISFEVDDEKIKRVDRQDGIKRLYIEEDIHLRDSNGKLKSDVHMVFVVVHQKKEREENKNELDRRWILSFLHRQRN